MITGFVKECDAILKLPKYVLFLVKVIILLASLFVSYFLLGKVLIYLAPFLVAAVLALAMEPLVRILQKYVRLKRGAAVGISLILVISLLISLLTLLISSIVVELLKFTSHLPAYRDMFVEYTADITTFVQSYIVQLPPEVVTRLQGSAYSLLSGIAEQTPKYITGLIGLMTSLPNMFVFVLIVILSTFFISRDRDLLVGFAGKVFSTDIVGQVSNVRTDLGGALFGWLKTQVVMMALTSVVVMIGLSFLKLDYIVVVGLLVGLVDALPIFGPGAVFVPWIVWALVTRHIWLAAGLSIIYLTTIVVRQLVEPRILSANIGLHPLVTLIAVYVGLRVFGVMGVALGPISVVTVKALHRSGILDYWFKA